MSHIVHEIPYLDTRDINLDWLVRKERELELRQAELEEKIATLDIPNLLIKVEDYGAVGDGVADDTNAIQRCIDENPDATIFFRDGIYRIVDTIHLWGAGGGQMIVLGGATIKYDGAFNYNRPMFSVDKDYSPLVTTSACRILGGNFDGNNKAGWCLEVFGFYTSVSYTKMWGFTSGGLCVGKIDRSASKSLQGKFSDIYIRNNAGFSLDDTEALRVTSPDNEFSGIVTDACKIAYHLFVGGNSFANCHSTQSFPGYTLAGVTRAQYDDTYHIYIDSPSSGATQINVFNGCYFNVGKYVVYNTLASRMCVTLDTCFYVFYASESLEFAGGYSVLCGGEPLDFRCTNIDILVSGNYFVLDYFPTSIPGITAVPDHIQVNSNDRHIEAPVYSAQNIQPEFTLTPLVSAGAPATLDSYYEVGALMLAYRGSSTTPAYTTPVKIVLFNSGGRAEWLVHFIGTAPNLTIEILEHSSTGAFIDATAFISTVPEMITIEGIVYPTYYIYLRKTVSASAYVFMTIDNQSPLVKTYMRAQVSEDHVLTDAGAIASLMQLDPSPTEHRNFYLFGDSYGLEVRNDTPHYGWTMTIKDRLEAMGHTVANLSISGAGFIAGTTFQDMVEARIRPVHTDVIIAGGVNDRSYTYADLVQAVKDCVAAVHAASPNCRVWIAEVGRTTNATEQALIDSVSYTAYRDGAMQSDNAFYLFNAQEVLDAGTDLLGDGVHPTWDGNAKLGNYMVQSLFGMTNPIIADPDLWSAGSGTNGIKMPNATDASGANSMAIGSLNTAAGASSFAGGGRSLARGSNSLAFGSYIDTEGQGSVAFGTANTTYRRDQFSFGRNNNPETGAAGTYGTLVEIVGNGPDNDNRSNARTLSWTGDEWLAGNLVAAGGRVNDYTGGTIIGSGTANVSITGDGALMLFCRGSDIVLYAVDYWTANATTIFSNGSDLPTITKTALSRDILITNPSTQSFAWMIIGSYLK